MLFALNRDNVSSKIKQPRQGHRFYAALGMRVFGKLPTIATATHKETLGSVIDHRQAAGPAVALNNALVCRTRFGFRRSLLIPHKKLHDLCPRVKDGVLYF